MIEIVIIILLMLLNGIFALAEIAFVSANDNKLRQLAIESKTARYVIALRKNPEKFLSTIQVSITLIGIISGVFSGLALSDDLSRLIANIPFLSPYAYQASLIILVILVAYFTIVFGELIPKTFALRNPEASILKLINIIRFFTIILYPFVAVLSLSVRLFFKVTKIRSITDNTDIDLVRQILGATKIAVTEKKIELEQEAIIKNAILINTIKLREIMVEKQNIKYLHSDMTLIDALLEAHTHQHTRYPVIERDKNKIIGYINFKDIINVLKFNPKNPSLLSICRPILQLNDQEYTINALKTMTKNFQHIALITDVQSNIVGLITLENIIETLVGDIGDEFDFIPDYVYKIADNRYVAGGKITLKKLSEAGIAVPPQNMFLNEWLQKHFGTDIKTDAKIQINNTTFIIRKIRRAKIFEIIIET